MAVVTIQVGQCGNQLGASLFQAIHEHAVPLPASPAATSAVAAATTECRRSFFRNGGVARAVIIDTEPKVIQRIVSGDQLRGEGVWHWQEREGGGPTAHPRNDRSCAERKSTIRRRTPKTFNASRIDIGRGSSSGGGGGGGGGGRGWVYDSGTQVCCHAQGGAANNWAYGYHVHGSAFAEACLESVRREAEQCDRLSGLCILQSAAGGTGSGLGTYLTEALRDYMPSAFLLNAVVCAHSSGEVILQNYNTLFTLSKLAMCSDGILVIENEAATAVCRKLLRLERPSHADLNNVISTSLAGALVPTFEASGVGGGSRRRPGSGRKHLGEKLAHLCPNKDFLFLRASMVPQMPDRSRAFTSNTWEALTRRAYQMHITGALADLELDWRKEAKPGVGAGAGLNQSISSLLTFHGVAPGGSSSTPSSPPPPPADCFRNRGLYARWSSTPLLECQSPLRLHGHDRAISLVSNSQAVLGVLERALERSRGMYTAGAYVHQYTKFGTERQDFDEAFLGIEQAVENYRSLG